jgi:hypothetical protein
MKLDEKILDKMLDVSKFTTSQIIDLGVKFWISKDFTEYPSKHHFIDVIQLQVLEDDTILLGSEEQFLKYKLY